LSVQVYGGEEQPELHPFYLKLERLKMKIESIKIVFPEGSNGWAYIYCGNTDIGTISYIDSDIALKWGTILNALGNKNSPDIIAKYILKSFSFYRAKEDKKLVDNPFENDTNTDNTKSSHSEQ